LFTVPGDRRNLFDKVAVSLEQRQLRCLRIRDWSNVRSDARSRWRYFSDADETERAANNDIFNDAQRALT
jgi:hypothetical protein